MLRSNAGTWKDPVWWLKFTLILTLIVGWTLYITETIP